MQIGTIKREGGKVSFCKGGISSPFLQLDLRCALEFYGHLVHNGEEIRASQWIKRIRKNYVKSSKRNHLIRQVVLCACNDKQAIKRAKRGKVNAK